MNRLLVSISMLVAVVGMTVSAQAVPQLDPQLAHYLNSSFESAERVRVIAIFNDRQPLEVNAPHSRIAAAQMEVAMRNNAKASQIATVQNIQAQSRTDGAPVYMKSLWILNALIIDMPANKLKTLMQNNDIRVIYANRQVHLFNGASGDQPSNVIPGTSAGFTYGLEKINIPQLRARAPNANGQGVRVGILDTGIDATHPDLQGRVATFKDFVANKTTPYDDNAHGTHVAGTISGGNASGTQIGIAPAVKLVVGKVFSSSGSASWDALLSAMQWIADPDGNPQTPDQPMLVSNSWGGGPPSGSTNPDDEPLCKAVNAWVKLGILPVFAAGNSGPGGASVGLPGACPAAVTVGATDQNDQIASFSSRGPVKWKAGTMIKPTVSAPGVGVQSSVPGGGYKAFSGTSMATPHVSGLAALIYQAAPNATVESVTKVLEMGAKDLGDPGQDNVFGFGRIDAVNSIKALTVLRGQGGI